MLYTLSELVAMVPFVSNHGVRSFVQQLGRAAFVAPAFV
jgi:hypothetical protein